MELKHIVDIVFDNEFIQKRLHVCIVEKFQLYRLHNCATSIINIKNLLFSLKYIFLVILFIVCLILSKLQLIWQPVNFAIKKQH